MTVQKIIGVLSRSIFTLAMLAGTYSVSSANQQALDWLQTQQGIAGDFSTQTLTSSAFQASAEVVAAWNLTGQVINPATVDFISAESYSSTEYLSLKIASHQSAGRDISGLTQQLLALQNADGGFGELAGYDSTSLDTAMAIIALSYADVSIQTVVSEAISYLLRNQQTDGGFPLKYPNDSAVYVSSLVSMALQKYMFSYDLSAAIDLTNTFILEQQLSTGGWQSTWETAIAIKAIAPVSTDVFNISSAIQRLQGDQLENGSWSNDVYTTALAIQADYLISQFQPPVGETVSGVTGKILDANSNIQIAGATVSLQENPSSMTQSVSDGVFRLQDFLPGQYTLVIEKPGYLPFTSSISTQGGQWLSLGVVHLSPASTTGFMTGFVSDAQTGLRIPGAQLSFSGSTSGNLLTDMSGSYDTVLTPGDVTVTVSATGYDLVVGSISVTPGSSINFSPALFATGTTPSTQTVTLRGLVIDAESGAVLPGVQIAVNQTDTAQSMDAPFEITDIPAGTIDVDLSLNGYVPAHYSTFSSAGGVLDLGIIRMERSADTSTSVVSGQVVDAADGMPVANAEVTLHGAPASVITDAAGYYLFNDVPGIEFSLAASAVGYQVASTSISVPAPGPVNYTIRLSRAAPADFDIVNVHTYQQQYEALSEVEVDAILSNTGTEDRNIILFNKVVNASNEVIGQFPSRYLPIGADVMDTMVVVTAGNLLETELEWDSARHQPGVYTLIIQAYDAYTSSLLAERPTQIEILPTRKIAGTGEFDPPVAQLAARKAIDIRANVVNRGNQPIDASTITARVQLNNQGYDVTNNPTEITVAASGQGMSAPKGIDVDVSGNIYVANSGAGSVSRISPEGIVSLFAEGLYQPVDIDIDTAGNIFVLLAQHGYIVYAPDGSSNMVSTGLNNQEGIEALPDGRVLIASAGTLYEVLPDGQISVIVDAGLAEAQGVVMDSQGAVYIANRNGNNIARYFNGALDTFVEGINQPYGITIDAQDTLYVTSYADNSLLSITQSGQVTTIATGLSGPYDLKQTSDGNFVVSNHTSSEIVSVTPQGVVSVIAGPSINNPAAMTYDASGNLYVGNINSANIIQYSPSLDTTELASARSIRDIKPGVAGGVNIISSYGGLQHIGNDGNITTISPTSYVAFEVKPDGSGFIGVEGSRIDEIATTGASSVYTERRITSAQSMRQSIDGDFYLLNQNSVIKLDTEGNYSVVVENLGSQLQGITEDQSGNVYVTDRTTRQILRIDTAGTVTEVATTSFVPGAIAVTAQGQILVAQWNGTEIYSVENGVVAAYRSLSQPIRYDLLMDSMGNLWASHYSASQVSKVASDGAVTLYSSIPFPENLFEDTAGNILVSAYGKVVGIDSTGLISTLVEDARLQGRHHRGVGLGDDGRLLILSSGNQLYRYGTDLQYELTFSPLVSPADLAFADNGSLILVARTNGILHLTSSSRLPILLSSENYSIIEKESASTMLVANQTTVKRLDIATGGLIDLASGFTQIGAVAVSPGGGFVVSDTNKNSLTFYDSQDNQVDRLVGIDSPRGILVDTNGDILFSNGSPNAIARLRADGKAELFADITSVEYMILDAQGQIVLTTSTRVMTLDASGAVLDESSFGQSTLKGVFAASNGDVLVTAGSGLYQYANGSFTQRVSGLTSVKDVEANETGDVYLADWNTSTISRVNDNGSLSLVSDSLFRPVSMAFSNDGTLFVSHSNTHVASLNPDGSLSPYKIDGVLNNTVGGLAFGANDELYAAVTSIDSVLRLLSTRPPVEPQPGEIIHTVTRDLPALGMDDVSVPIDFGSWTPEYSGDYIVEITVDDGQTTGMLTNSLHVGPIAQGSLNLSQSVVLPGDRAISGMLNIVGADSTTVTRVDTDGLTYAASSGATGSRALAADSHGNIYVGDRTRIVRMAPDMSVTTFVSNITVGWGLAVDSADTIYAVSGNNVLSITPDAQVSVMTTLPQRAIAVATDYDDNVYAVDTDDLYRILPDGSLSHIRHIENTEGLTIDAFGNFYLVKGQLAQPAQVIRVTPDGEQASVYLDDVSFEFEGVTVTADCSNNLLFAPWQIDPFKPVGGEEDKIIQFIGDTGELREVLFGPPIDTAMADMDMLFYDRHGKRLIIWTDRNAGKVFSFPVICGGIDVEAHVVTRQDVDLASVDPAPTTIINHPDGTREFIWLLSEVDNRGRNIQLNMLFSGLTEAETRPAFSQAFLQFSNSFDPANPVQVPLDIPSLTANTAVSVNPALNASQYGPNADTHINVTVTNDSGSVFNGTVELMIVDNAGAPVATLPAIDVTALAALNSTIYSAQWNTGLIYAGDYRLETRLLNQDGLEVATGQAAFVVTAQNQSSSAITNSQVSTDKPTYEAWDRVNIEARVSNQSDNIIQLPGNAVISITAPDNTVIYSTGFAVRELYAGSYQDIATQINLVDALEGIYTINLSYNDVSTGVQLTSSSTSFNVGKTVTQAVTGTVSASPKVTDAGGSVVCNSRVNNISASSISNVLVLQQLANMTTGEILSTEQASSTLLAGSNTTFSRSIDTLGLAQGAYACLLSVDIAGESKQLSAAGFLVNQTAVQLDTQVTSQGPGRVLVFVDDPARTSDLEPNGPDLAPLMSYQRTYLETLLNNAGWSYTIVDNLNAFLTELHQGGYTSYALFNEKIVLDKEIQMELREAVYSGAGLIVAGGQWVHIWDLAESLGVGLDGSTINHAGIIDFTTSPLQITGEQILPHYEVMNCFPIQGAQIAAVSREDASLETLCTETNRAAVTTYDFGNGRSVFMAFDLLAQAADTQQTELLDDLLLNAFTHIHPANIQQVPNKMVPATITVTSTGTATSTRVLVSAPLTVPFVDTAGGELLANNTVSHEFSLDSGESHSYSVWIQLPDSTDPVTVNVQTQAGDGTGWTTVGTQSVVFTPLALPGMAEAEAALQADTSGHWMVAEALNLLTLAQQSIAAGDYLRAIKYLGDVADYVRWLELSNSHEIRLMIGTAMRETARLML